MVALSSAQGYAQVTGKPAAVIVHVDVGTQALAGAIHNVDRGQTPVLIYAGASAFTSNGELKGSRNEWIMWIQDIPDQAAIVRQYMRHTAQINSSHDVAEVVKRSLQIATSHPRGPVYLWSRREVMESEVDASVLDASGLDRRQWPSVEATALSPTALSAIATAFMTATNPLIVTSSLGRNVDAVEPLLAFSTLLAIPIVITCPSVVNVPFSHPFLDSISYLNRNVPNKHLANADAILVIDSDLPWIPSLAVPSDKARVFVVSGADPLKASSIGSWHVAAEMICQADAQVALTQIVERVRQLDEQRGSVGEQILGSRIVQDRGQLLKDAHTAWLDNLEDRERDFSGDHLTVPNIIGALRRAIELHTSSRGVETLVLNEAISNFGAVWEQLRPEVLGSVFTSGGSALGWALGASVGAYLGGEVKSHQIEGARPNELVVAIVGDGSFMFGVPSSAYWMARKYGTPFLTIVLNNGGWKSPKLSMLGVYPSGLGSQAIGERLSVGFGPDSPDFSQIAVAASGGWAWGKRVVGSDALALEEDLAEAVNVVVKERRCAILDCILESI